MPAERTITPWSPSTSLIADEFHRGVGYTNWRPFGSGDYLLIYTISGQGHFVTSEGVFESRPGKAILYYPGEAQDYSTTSALGEWNLLWVHFMPKPHLQDQLSWPRNRYGLHCLLLNEGETRDEFHNALQRVVRLCHRRFVGAEELAAHALAEALLWAGTVLRRGGAPGMDPRIRRAIDFLSAGKTEPFSLPATASYSGISVSRLAFLFKRETGFSPHAYWERHRLQRATRLLRVTGLSVSEIAQEVGFNDPFYFTNRFRRFTGYSPTAYRDNPCRKTEF